MGALLLVLGAWSGVRQAILDQRLITAIHNDDSVLVRRLLAQKADPNTQELIYTEILKERLLSRKAQITSAPPALIVALFREEEPSQQTANTEIIETLLQAGADPNVRYRDGDTPLMIAIWQGKSQVLETLLARRAEIEARNDFGVTPVMKAAGAGDAKTIALLCSRGADINAKDNYGCNALWFANLYSQPGSVQSLIACKIDVNAHDNAGTTALTNASQYQLPQIVALLKKAGATK